MSDQSAGAQHDIIGIDEAEGNYSRTTHPGALWFPEAGLGLFLHWGLSSVGGNMDLSWGMMANTPYDGEMYNTNKMKPTDYWKLAEKFSPDRYKPEHWLAAAKKAGFTYAVLTTRHHEGFALWPSAYGDFNTKNFIAGRDLVEEYVTACRNTGMKVGFYYSPPDWRWCRNYMSFNYRSRFWPEDWAKKHPDAYSLVPQETWDENWRVRGPVEKMPKEKEIEFARYVRGQILELLSNYGKIDIVWFDGNPFETLMPVTVDEIRSAQPGILINPRLHGTVDFATPENRIPKKKPEGWWEGCFIWNRGSWGYSACERYETTGWFLDI
ncbi:MAG: glycoside hydrolase, partial [Spirochaetales bacterium]|nr:glycoside hydrolase [Spirochaetales bacterium]